MSKLYLLGGEDVAERDSKEINEQAFADASGTPAVLVFSWTARTGEKTRKYRKIMSDYFQDLGARSVQFAELSDSWQRIKEKVDASDLIYLPGGDAGLLVERTRSTEADSLIRRYDKVIVGNSAGALALCKDYVIVKGQDTGPKTEIASGLGLVDFAVTVHYGSSKVPYSSHALDKQLKELSEKTALRIYAIPERCALICDDGVLRLQGVVYLFYRGKKTRCK